ncbi:MAG: penicillin-binding transpeptidase domain-containing protein, partial [Gemmatimonadota bacterium]
VAALEPGTAEVLALYSSPSFDPNRLTGSVAPEHWAALQRDPARRLLNRATAGLYPPGSTWKLATAAIALELGIVEPDALMPVACRGGMQYGNRYFRCWDPAGHGYTTLPEAIRHSCNVYFYQVGLQIGLARLLEEGVRLGFDDRTGIDLPSERAGVFPTGIGWFERRFGLRPTESEVLSLAIGQGANDQTPLKMAQFFASLASDGTAPAPRVVRDRPLPTGPELDLQIAPETLEPLREGLRRVTAQGGTAGGSALEHWDWIGKTGTSQNPHGKDHGWFVGLAGPRGGEPEIVVAALIEEGEHGSDVAQIAAKAADYYLRSRRGMPIDTVQTLREHWLNGVPAPWAQWD